MIPLKINLVLMYINIALVDTKGNSAVEWESHIYVKVGMRTMVISCFTNF